MTGSDSFLAQMFEISGGTWFLFCLIGGSALIVIRNHVPNALLLVVTFPIVLVMSVAIFHVSRVLLLFNPDKMADWLAWTIMTGTAGTMIGIGFVVLVGRVQDRPVASRAG